MKHTNTAKRKNSLFKVGVAILLAFVVALTTYDYAAPAFAVDEDVPETQATEEYTAPEDGNEEEVAEEATDVVVPETDAEATTITAKGKTYNVFVTYGEDAQIPADAELQVEEIGESSKEFDEYIERTEDAIGDDRAIAFARFFDIKIMSGGAEIEPVAPVEVVIELADDIKGEEVAAIHFGYDVKDASKPDDQVLDAEVTRAETKKMDSAVSFDAAGFSVYAVVTTTDLQTETDVSKLDGGSFFVGVENNNGRYYAKNSLSGNYIAKTNVSDIDSAALYYFELAGGTENQFYVYTYNEDNEKAYLNMANNSGNFSFSAEPGTAFTVETHANKSEAFYIYNKSGNKKYAWAFHSNGIIGSTANPGGTNQVFLVKPLEEDDPFDLDGKSFGILNNNNTVSGTAIMAKADGNKLTGKSLTVRTDPVSRTGNVFVAENSNITMWTFTHVAGDKYNISADVDGATKYLGITSGALVLLDEPDASCLITIERGTGKYTGKYKFSCDGSTIRLNGGKFERLADNNVSNDSVWMNLAEKSSLNDDDFVTYTAYKVSVSGKVNDDGTIDYDVKNGDQIILYTRIWNDNTKRYDYYAVDYDGVLVQAYASGETISWVGTKVNTMLWNFTEYYNDDGTPNYYYELENDYSDKYIAPQLTGGGSVLSDNTIGINLNGRRNKKYYTTILAWDDPYYDYVSLKAGEGEVTASTFSKADTFYFAVMRPQEQEQTLSQAATVNHKPFGIEVQMLNYPGGSQTTAGGNYQNMIQTNVLGKTSKTGSVVYENLLKKNLSGNGYPDVAYEGYTDHNLSELYADCTAADEITVNHSFLASTYSETGYFEYDSTQNFAHLITSEDDIWFGKPTPSGGTYGVGDFVVYDDLGTTSEVGDTRRHGQFFPYNDLAESVEVDEEGNVVITPKYQYSKTMKNTTGIKGQSLSTLDPRYGEELYEIPNSTTTKLAPYVDHYFGMEMTASFMQSESGLDDWGHDLIFEFSGDDDFWLYVDGKLVLDLGGVHSACDGRINFKTGAVNVNGNPTTLRALYKEAYVEENPGASEDEINEWLNTWFEDDGSNTGTVFKDFSGHKMRMFYMERGAGASNIHMRFNLAPYTEGEVLLQKEVSGAENIDPETKYPYQIMWKNPERPGDEFIPVTRDEESGDDDDPDVTVTDSKTGDPIEYAKSYEVDGITYNDVFFLTAGQIASIKFPSEDIQYYIRECGMSTSTYDKVTINKKEVAGKETVPPTEGRLDFETGRQKVSELKKIVYNNHVSKDAQKSLLITKYVWEEDNKTGPITAETDKTPFKFRIYIGKDKNGNYTVYNTGKYYVKNPEGKYCIYENGFVSTGKTDFSQLSDVVPPGELKSEKEKATFRTSPGGAAERIPIGYTIEVPELMAGAFFMVEERAYETPAGYTLIYYEREGGAPAGEEENAGTIRTKDEHVIVNNQHGYGLNLEKKWSDDPFMEYHDETYFAVYQKSKDAQDETVLNLIDGSIHQLPKKGTTIKWFFPELDAGKTLNDYLIYEVTLTKDKYTVDDAGVVTPDPDCVVTRVKEGGVVTVGGKTNEHGYSTTYDYTVSYDRQTLTPQQIEDNANSRKDTVTNARPGLKLVKTDMKGRPLDGGKFTLVSKDDPSKRKTFTSDEDGLIAMAYLTAGEDYVLTETTAPFKYLSLIDPLTIRVKDDNTVYVNGETEAPEGAFYTITQVPDPTVENMPTISIMNKPFTLNAKKLDAENGNPVEGVVFELYKEVKESGTDNPRPDYEPMEGFENLVTEADGTIPKVDLNNLKAKTYYLREKSAPPQFRKFDYDIRLIIAETGDISVQKAEYSEEEGKYVFEDFTDGSAETVPDEEGNLTLNVKDEPVKVVKIVKKARMTYGDDQELPGVGFELYRENQVEEDKPKEGEEPVVSGTTGDDGVLELGALSGQSVYYLFETSVPEGYVGIDGPVIITTKKNGSVKEVTHDGQELAFEVTTDDHNIETASITIVNMAKFELQLTKTLPAYVDNGAGNNTAFVFELTGYVKDKETGQETVKYHKFIGMEFTVDGERTQTLTVKNIPGGLSKLTVKETYGGNFTAVTSETQPEVREAEGPDANGVYTVSFENKLDNKTHSSGVVNRYELEEDGFHHH